MLLTPNCIRRPRGGFSLAELMVVIVIIGLLATVVVPNLMLHFGTAQTTKAKADITAIAEAVKSFTILNGGMHPDSIEQLFMPDENGNRLMDRDSIPTPTKSLRGRSRSSSGATARTGRSAARATIAISTTA